MPEIGKKFQRVSHLGFEELKQVKYYRTKESEFRCAAYAAIGFPAYKTSDVVPEMRGFSIGFVSYLNGYYLYCDPLEYAQRQVEMIKGETGHLFDLSVEDGGFGGSVELATEFYLRAAHERVRLERGFDDESPGSGSLRPCWAPVPKPPRFSPTSDMDEIKSRSESYEAYTAEVERLTNMGQRPQSLDMVPEVPEHVEPEVAGDSSTEVPTTTPQDDLPKSQDDLPKPQDDLPDALFEKTRAQLEQIAAEMGIEDVSDGRKYPNKESLIVVIRETEASA